MSSVAKEAEISTSTTLFSGLGFHARVVSQVVQPKSAQELQQYIAQAYQNKQPVYPIGKGNNWGYGCKTPPSDGCTLLDLSAMNQILSFDETLGVIEIEPGVTQGQVARYLENTPWILDCTGAGPDTSIMGNVLERGFGHGPVGNRSQHFTISELILADGEVIRLNQSSRYCGRAGLSANLHELFTQNNIAVISKMTFELMRKPECSLRCLVRLKSPEHLPDYIDIMRRLKSEGTIDGLPHLGNTYRMLTMMERFNFERWDPAKGANEADIAQLCQQYQLTPWSGAFVITGATSIAKAKAAQVKKLLTPIAQVNIVSLKTLKQLNQIAQKFSPVFGRIALYRRFQNSLNDFTEMMDMLEGNPKDMALKGCYWRYRKDIPAKMNPVEDGCGFFWVAPALPLIGDDVEQCIQLSQKAFDAAGFEFGVTLTAVNAHLCQAIISIYYDTTDKNEVERATRLAQELRALYREQRWPCYRRSVDEMPFDSEQEFELDALKLRQRIKAAFDPEDMVSPGRYQPNPSLDFSKEHQG
ncbi:FAD-binding protein [Photobacterium galatheae]|uniref:4-cresol dehydrogenase n=1 Tax=Photobacterium galatheae TaxID=1654360 RepID=A0A066RRH5_9GAMM|nr:FAD-dependent oxidoreductase [Photobacterium galatheae]KDM90272.1 4-cresol dehydrogenase [Photobacterium galatheae]MCM0151466.1 FAD-binding protein [Photobacterium galatheae]